VNVDVGAARLFVQQSGDGPALLLVHSLSFDGDMWAAQARALHGRYRVLRLDLRGHGRSRGDSAGVSLEDLADDVARVLDALDIHRVGYAGLSLGGMVGMRLCLRHPERVAALALLNTSAEPEPEGVRQMYDQANERSRGGGDNPAVTEMMLGLMFSDEFRNEQPTLVDSYRQKLVERGDPEGLYHVARAVIWRDSILQDLERIAVPSLVVTSSGDRALPAERGVAIAGAIPGCGLLAIDGAGHMTAVEQPDAVTAALSELFDTTVGALP